MRFSTLSLQLVPTSTAMAPAYWDVILAKCVAPLAAEGFPVATWNTDAVARSYLTTPKFIKAVNILTREADDFIFLRVIHRGNSGDWWDAAATCTPAQMYKFCNWLRSSEGAAYLDEQRWLRRLEKKAVVGQNVDDVCYLAAMEAQLKLYLSAAGIMAGREGEEMKADYLPASAYVAMDEMEVGKECYKLYVAQCVWRGKRAEELSNRVLQDAIAVYRWEAAARHKTEFMRDAKRREEMKVWLEGRMSEAERVGDVSQAKNYRFYLNITCGDERECSVLGRRQREDEDEDDESILDDEDDTDTDDDEEEEDDDDNEMEEEEEEEEEEEKDNEDEDDDEEDDDYKGEEEWEEAEKGRINAV